MMTKKYQQSFTAEELGQIQQAATYVWGECSGDLSQLEGPRITLRDAIEITADAGRMQAEMTRSGQAALAQKWTETDYDQVKRILRPIKQWF
jgi:hypothetical protein